MFDTEAVSESKPTISGYTQNILFDLWLPVGGKMRQTDPQEDSET